MPFRYQGQYYDEETNLCYNRFRYYNPETGLYISKDPISILGGLNVYAYVKDVNKFVDIFGLTPWKELGIGFEEWWDTKATIDSISRNKSSVERALRAMNGGNNHEMFPVSLAEKAKELGFKYSELEKMTIKTSKIEFDVDGIKGAHPSSGVFNNSASASFHKMLISELKEAKTKKSAKEIIKNLHNKHMTIKNINICKGK